MTCALQDKSENIFDAPLIEYNENNMISVCASAFVRAMVGGAGSSMLRMASPTCASSELCFPFLGFNKIAFVIRQEEAHMQQGARCTKKNWNQDTHLEFSVLLHQHNNSLSYCRDTGYFPFLPLPSSQQPWFPYHCSLQGSVCLPSHSHRNAHWQHTGLS
ncbi:uncharacterized protein [Triticum aestivum]|uniref:uncharacterized protein n=1 Tax=Triticum aestivum TaxID=4565 RepID=UPI001D02AE05|nr:uncharacterized protein LOC123096883 [Triticum aestivum]